MGSQLFKFIVDALPDAIIWVVPVIKGGEVTDFSVGYSNAKANELIAHPKGNLQGLLIRADGIPTPESGEANFLHFLQVYNGQDSSFRFSTLAKHRVQTFRSRLAEEATGYSWPT